MNDTSIVEILLVEDNPVNRQAASIIPGGRLRMHPKSFCWT